MKITGCEMIAATEQIEPNMTYLLQNDHGSASG